MTYDESDRADDRRAIAAYRLILARLNDDDHAYDVAADEAGDHADYWRGHHAYDVAADEAGDHADYWRGIAEHLIDLMVEKGFFNCDVCFQAADYVQLEIATLLNRVEPVEGHVTPAQLQRMGDLLYHAELDDRESRRGFAEVVINRRADHLIDLTQNEASKIIERLETRLTEDTRN
jgi:hypothetical protein